MLGIFKKRNKISLVSPMTGEIIRIEDVPDEVFSQKMVGDGIAIKPTDKIVLSPCEGKVIQVFPTNHAIGIETKEGLEILIHIGIDTVNLKGKGFKRLIEPGCVVKPGDRLLEIDIDFIKSNATSIISPIVITNMTKVSSLKKVEEHSIKTREEILEIQLK